MAIYLSLDKYKILLFPLRCDKYRNLMRCLIYSFQDVAFSTLVAEKWV